MWTTWTDYNGGAIKTEHVVVQNSDTSFLLLYNASVNKYMCLIFSNYSADKPEDQRVVAVVLPGKSIFLKSEILILKVMFMFGPMPV